MLSGGEGADTLAFARGTGRDLFGNFALGSTVIDLGQGDGIRLNGVANAALTAADFLYA